MAKQKILTDSGLTRYDSEIKKYIKEHNSGITIEELTPLLDEKAPSNDGISANSAIKAIQDASGNIISDVYATKSEIDKLDIIGRNLVPDTTDGYRTALIGQFYTVIQSFNISELMEKYNIKDGDDITFSIYIRSDSGKQLNARLQLYNSQDDRTSNVSQVSIQNSEGTSYVALKLKTSYEKLQLCINNSYTNISNTTTEYYKCVKLEKGNKVTDWIPSLEDVDLKINEVKAELITLDTSIITNDDIDSIFDEIN